MRIVPVEFSIRFDIHVPEEGDEETEALLKRALAASNECLSAGGFVGDASNFSDLTDILESMAHLMRRARASGHGGGATEP